MENEKIKVSEEIISSAKSLGITVGKCPEGKFAYLKAERPMNISHIFNVISQIKQENPTLKLNAKTTFYGGIHRAFVEPEERY